MKSLSLMKVSILTLFLGIVASVLHFTYDLSGDFIVIGLFFPINESVWEHLKFMFFPLAVYWIIIYFKNQKDIKLNLNKYLFAACVSTLTAPLLVILFFYSYTSALGTESLIVDILLVFVCYFLALLLAKHLYDYYKPRKTITIISLCLVIVLAICFFVFTFIQPDLPIFISPV